MSAFVYCLSHFQLTYFLTYYLPFSAPILILTALLLLPLLALSFSPHPLFVSPTLRARTPPLHSFLDDIAANIKSVLNPPQAAASHILMKGPDASAKLLEIKEMVGGDAAAFAEAAAENSACPSSAKGGSLGKFKRGQMVPEFDKVVFNEAVGEVHGPITTSFGSHLIRIESRDE